MKHALRWFEIPVTNLDRAAAFYEAVFEVTLWRDTVAGTPHAIFPVAEGGITGALVTRAPAPPGSFGTTVYLVCENAAAAVERARHAGGELVMEPTLLTNIGVIAAIRDLDHNVIGLHAAM